jgi:hypothetical protein
MQPIIDSKLYLGREKNRHKKIKKNYKKIDSIATLISPQYFWSFTIL